MKVYFRTAVIRSIKTEAKVSGSKPGLLCLYCTSESPGGHDKMQSPILQVVHFKQAPSEAQAAILGPGPHLYSQNVSISAQSTSPGSGTPQTSLPLSSL